jgi:hypothetical protein
MSSTQVGAAFPGPPSPPEPHRSGQVRPLCPCVALPVPAVVTRTHKGRQVLPRLRLREKPGEVESAGVAARIAESYWRRRRESG